MNSAQPIVFRNATLADVSTVIELVESAYRGEASRAGWTTEADLLDGQRTDELEIREIISGAHSRIRLAQQHNGIEHDPQQTEAHARMPQHALTTTSSIVACVRIENAGDAGYIGMVSVRPKLQAAGIGRQLLQEAERIIRDELGLSRARMTVIAQRETLISWYQRRGYSLTGKREKFPYGEPRAGTPRRDDLYFEVLEKTFSPHH
jgi:ribosomal protein S18 acetylase RimI-like enzyme